MEENFSISAEKTALPFSADRRFSDTRRLHAVEGTFITRRFIKGLSRETETIIQESCRAYRPVQKRPGKLWPPLFGDVITRRFANHPSSLPFSPPLIRIKMSRCLTAFAMIFLFGLNAIACPLRDRRRVYQKPFLRFFPQTSERSRNSTTALFHFFTPDCCPGTSYPRSYAYTGLN